MVTVESEIRSILSSKLSREIYTLAHSAWIQQMDGPYQRSYGEVIYSLSEEQRATLEEFAFMSLEETGWFDDILIEQAAAKPRPEFEAVFRRLAQPPIKAVFRQDATRVFLLAAIGLRRLHAEIPVADAQTGAVAAWWTLAEIFCEMFSLGSPSEERGRQAWSRLFGPLIDDAFEPISDILRAETLDRESHTLQVSAIRKYPAELRQIARHYLSKHEAAGDKQDWHRHDCLRTAIEMIRVYGERGDVELLRQFVDDASCVRAAIDAIKELQLRT